MYIFKVVDCSFERCQIVGWRTRDEASVLYNRYVEIRDLHINSLASILWCSIKATIANPRWSGSMRAGILEVRVIKGFAYGNPAKSKVAVRRDRFT